jgi:phosphatidylserine/phosphatidylglycerophosphate/cardiolipin synthase-like enzyme
LLIANWTMWPNNLPGLDSLAALPNVEIRVTAIPPASTGFIPYARVVHTKIMTIDGRTAWVGTSNWEGGYLDNSRNVEVVVRDRRMAARLGALHEQMWSSAYSLPYAQARLIPRPVTQPPRPPAATPPPAARPETTQPQ